MRAAIIALTLFAAHDFASAKCAMPFTGSEIRTPAGTKLARDGGVLVGSAVSFGDTRVVGEDTALNPSWRFSDGRKTYEPELVTLAPGLVVYRPKAGAKGTLTLVDGKHTRAKVELTTATPALLGAPELTAVKLHTERLVRGGTALRLRATFASAPPAGAVAVVVYGITKTGKQPRSWAATAKDTTVQVAGSAGRCNPGIPGEIVSKVGDSIVLAWVDTHGRLSAFSKPITVQQAP